MKYNQESAAPEEFLFNPVCYIPFGHSDGLGLVLLDDWEVAHRVGDSATTTVESFTLAFCPALNSLGIAADDRLFCEVDSLLGPEYLMPQELEDNGEEGVAIEDRRFKPAAHKFQESAPLLLFSKFKAHGLGMVGSGLLFQQALFLAMADKIRNTVQLLRKEAGNSDTPMAKLMSAEQIDATKVAFLDLQGSQEIGILVFCANLSVSASILAGVRSLVFEDLLVSSVDKNGWLRDTLDRSEAHAKIIKNDRRAPNREGDTCHPLDKVHVFRWTHSTSAIAWNAFQFPPTERTERWGYVEATSEFEVAPGHRVSVEEALAEMNKRCKPAEFPLRNSENCHRYTIGVPDIPFLHGDTTGCSDCLWPLGELVLTAREFFRMFGHANPENESGRDITGCSTALIVPIPKILDTGEDGRIVDLICGEKHADHFAPLMNVLRKTQLRLCYPERLQPEERTGNCGRLSIVKLRDACRKHGVPISLRRTIEYLYRCFATLIADPFIFDIVLDLYDSFATLHEVLVKWIPDDKAFALPAYGGMGRQLVTKKEVGDIARMVDAMHDALEHRMFGAHLEPPFRETGFDFRGGFNQLLFAADVPLKCGLGLLRKYVQPSNGSDQRTTVGIPTHIRFEPGVKVWTRPFGNEEEPSQIGVFEGDVPHVLNVFQYPDHLHEAFHLLFTGICMRKQRDQSWPLNTVRDDEVMQTRLSEAFANYLVQLFVWGRDVETFRRHSLISYSQSIDSTGLDKRDTLVRLTEWLTQVFLATDVLADREDISGDPFLVDEPACWGQDGWMERADDSPDKVLARFVRMMHEVTPLFADHEHFSTGGEWCRFKAYSVAQFKDSWLKTGQLIQPIWQEGMAVYRRFVNSVFPGGQLVTGTEETDKDIAKALATLDKRQMSRLNRMRKYVDDAVEAARKDGRAVVRNACPEEYRSGEDHALDPLMVVCAVLRNYVGPIDIDERRRQLDRDPETGRVKFDPEAEYHTFLIDRGAPSMFCAVPDARRKRLKHRISVVKTFWDISSSLRARRLAEIMRDNW